MGVSIFVLTMTILLASSIFLSRTAGEFLISSFREKADISVYFKEDSQEEEILNVRNELAAIPQVKDINYVSKEKALEFFNQKYAKDPVLMESVEIVGGSPFLASLNIRAFDAGQYGAIVNFLENPALENMVEKIDYFQRKSVIERIFYLTDVITKAGAAFAAILIIIALLISFNTVRLAIFHFGEEIKVQRLVGASNWFIRGPFLVQGLLAGVISAAISLLVFGIAVWFLSPQVEFFFEDLNLFSMFFSQFWNFFLLQMAIGLGLGIFSSWLAVRKYLKV